MDLEAPEEPLLSHALTVVSNKHDSELSVKSTVEQFENTEDPLRNYLVSDFRISIFMFFMLVDWSFGAMNRRTAVIVGIYYVSMIAFLLYVIKELFDYIIDNSKYAEVIGDDSVGLGFVLSAYFFGITIISQACSGIVCNYYAARRVSEKCPRADIKHIRHVMILCFFFSLAFFCISIIGGLIECWHLHANYLLQELFAVTAFTIVTSGFVVINIFFVMIDAAASREILADLIAKAENRVLQMTELETAREEISRRYKDFAIPTLLMSFNALLCGSTFIIELFVTKYTEIGLTLISIAWYLKEVVYLFIVLFLSAQLNAQANQLQKLIGTDHWAEPQEMQRIQLFVNLQANPISFKLLGSRPTVSSVTWQCISVSFALIFSFIRGVLWF